MIGSVLGADDTILMAQSEESQGEDGYLEAVTLRHSAGYRRDKGELALGLLDCIQGRIIALAGVGDGRDVHQGIGLRLGGRPHDSYRDCGDTQDGYDRRIYDLSPYRFIAEINFCFHVLIFPFQNCAVTIFFPPSGKYSHKNAKMLAHSVFYTPRVTLWCFYTNNRAMF